MDKRLARFAQVCIMVMRHSKRDWTINMDSSSVYLYWETRVIDGTVEDYGKLTGFIMRTRDELAIVRK